MASPDQRPRTPSPENNPPQENSSVLATVRKELRERVEQGSLHHIGERTTGTIDLLPEGNQGTTTTRIFVATNPTYDSVDFAKQACGLVTTVATDEVRRGGGIMGTPEGKMYICGITIPFKEMRAGQEVAVAGETTSYDVVEKTEVVVAPTEEAAQKAFELESGLLDTSKLSLREENLIENLAVLLPQKQGEADDKPQRKGKITLFDRFRHR